MAERFHQVGIMAARDPITREFLPSVPLYERVTPEAEQAEEKAISDVGRLFAEKMKQYIDAGGIVGKSKNKRKGSK